MTPTGALTETPFFYHFFTGARLDGVDIPDPVFTCSIEAESSEDEDAFNVALDSIQIEDPSVSVTLDKDTGQKLISGMGELHLEIILSRLKTQYNLDCSTGPMQVAYRERPTVEVSCTHGIVRMIAGREQAVDMTLALTCRPGTSPFSWPAPLRAPSVYNFDIFCVHCTAALFA